MNRKSTPFLTGNAPFSGPRRRRLERRTDQWKPVAAGERNRRVKEGSVEPVVGEIDAGVGVRKERLGQVEVVARSQSFAETSVGLK